MPVETLLLHLGHAGVELARLWDKYEPTSFFINAVCR